MIVDQTCTLIVHAATPPPAPAPKTTLD